MDHRQERRGSGGQPNVANPPPRGQRRRHRQDRGRVRARPGGVRRPIAQRLSAAMSVVHDLRHALVHQSQGDKMS